MYLVAVAPSVTALCQVARNVELVDDGSSGPLGYPNLLCQIVDAHRGVVRNDLEHVGMVRYESENLVSISGS